MIATKKITVTQAAEELGYSRERIHQICHAHNLGEMITPQLRLLSRKEVLFIKKILATMKIGRPPKNPE